MVMPAAPLSRLTLLDGGRKPDRRTAQDFAHVEAIAFMDEVKAAAAAIVDAITGLPVPSMYAINEAMRLAHRAEKARDELLSLGGGDAA